MKTRFLLFAALLLAACATPSEDGAAAAKSDPTATAVLSPAEISYYAGLSAQESGADEACIAEKLLPLSQAPAFRNYIEQEIKCGTSDNPRRTAISYIQQHAIGACGDYQQCQGGAWLPPGAKCPIYMSCWDGTIPNRRDPCNKSCPPSPQP